MTPFVILQYQSYSLVSHEILNDFYALLVDRVVGRESGWFDSNLDRGSALLGWLSTLFFF